ncbi:hypothetical protein KM043_001464 [Ampulex compressa]|nr:hypothetical protein KM043_001464 [Ampulex compressa]
MWDIGFPCVTSAFCLIQLAFLQLTQLKFGPEKIQQESCLSLAITGHFFCIIASDVASTSHNCYMAKYVVQTVFLVWSISLYLTFLHAGYKAMHLLRTIPNSMLTRDNSNSHQKGLTIFSSTPNKIKNRVPFDNSCVIAVGIMQLAMLAPYSNLATSVAAALVPTLLSPKSKCTEQSETINLEKDGDQASKARGTGVEGQEERAERDERDAMESSESGAPRRALPTVHEPMRMVQAVSTVPEVYVRPPTPTPSAANLPIITVSSPSRRSSIASRRGSDASRSSRRNSECSVRFINEEEQLSCATRRRSSEFSPGHSPDLERRRSPDTISRRHSENITPSGSTKELRRCSDFSHEKNRSSQFATKLRRNSDFGNRTPRRMLPPDDQHRLPKVLDTSPAGSRRNSDIGGFTSPRSESRRNSDICHRRSSEFVQIKPLMIDRRSSDISIRTLDKSPTHYQGVTQSKVEIPERSESDSDQPDCSEKAALMNEKAKDKEEEARARKKNLSWKNDGIKEEMDDITAETNLLPENATSEGRAMATEFTLHSILNHIAYVNRAKSDTPLQIPEANTAAMRRSQIRRVLNMTYATAILGIILCIVDIVRIFGPYGLLAETVKYGTRPTVSQYPKPWPWLFYQTICRGLELIIGCAMASITKQPSVSPRHQYLSSYPNYNTRMKQGNDLIKRYAAR